MNNVNMITTKSPIPNSKHKPSMKATQGNMSLEEENLQLQQQVNNLQHLIYNMAHNLRAPIASVMGIVQLIQLDKNDNESYFQMMDDCLKKLDNEIQNVLSYSRNSKSELLIEALCLNEMVNETWNSLQYMNNASQLNFSFENNIKEEFYSDHKRLQVIMLNLLSNAIKYHQPEESNPFIQVKAYSDPNKYYLEFSDNGEGMDYKTQQNIFEMFYRGSAKSEGSGLGMYIVKEALNKLQGSIKVSSELYQGTTFLIILPKQIS